MMTQQELIQALEPMVDASGLADVVLALARMCNEKAEHLATNWQDASAAKQWDKAASLLDRVSAQFNIPGQ